MRSWRRAPCRRRPSSRARLRRRPVLPARPARSARPRTRQFEPSPFDTVAGESLGLVHDRQRARQSRCRAVAVRRRLSRQGRRRPPVARAAARVAAHVRRVVRHRPARARLAVAHAAERIYALSVQGGGIGVLYLTIYASFGLYHLLPAALAFALLIGVTAAAGVLAVLQDARSLAVLGTLGGFLAPVLVSTGSGNHVALFGYYALLNVAIVGIAWFKAWRVLNVLGFVFTFGVGTLWGIDGVHARQVRDAPSRSSMLFTLMYLVIPVLFATRSEPKLRGFVDGTSDVRHADRRVHVAAATRRRHGVRPRDQRRRARAAVRRHGDVPVSLAQREVARARRGAARARRRVRHGRRAARARCAVDVGCVGAGGRGTRVARVPATTQARIVRGSRVAGAVGCCLRRAVARTWSSGRS